MSFVYPVPVQAASTISFYPASGVYIGTFNVAVKINTGGDKIYGIDMRINYSGPISYVTASAGNLGCSPSFSTGSGYVRILCLIPPPSSYSGSSGTVAVLAFRPTGSGAAGLQAANVEIAGSISGSTLPATFTVATSQGGLAPGVYPTRLPESGIFDQHPVLVGVALFLVAGVLFALFPSQSKIVYVPVSNLNRMKRHARNVIVLTE